jgi:hypothetical protein
VFHGPAGRLSVAGRICQGPGVSRALARARDRFEATPRSLDDDELTRIARGDRGCLGDLISGVGAVCLVAAVILGATETISFTWTYVAVAIWVGGFVWGTVAQSRSGKRRKAALESGPLVMAVVVREEPWLRRPGKRAGRAVVLFTTDEARRFDRDWLERMAERLEAKLAAEAGSAEWVPLRALLADRDAFGMHQIPAELSREGGQASEDGGDEAPPLHLGTVVVHPERLEGAYLGGEDDREAGEQDLDLDAPARPPAVFVIVDPERGFIEQVPRPLPTESESEQDS